MEYGLGIDFGTTYSAAAISTSRGVEICTLGTRAASIPTAVLVRADGQVLVGEAAERRALEEPDRGAFAFKRRLGDSTPLVLGGTPYGAETLTSYVLASIVRQVTQQNGGPPTKIVVTHPAPFGDYKVDQLRLAARQADIGPVSFISEPEAAAVHYSTLERIDVGQVVAVYDFGGGTFDAALLRRTADGFTLIGHPEGLERIGGIDLDHAVLQHVLGVIGTQPADLLRDNAGAATARLRDDCRSAKEALSSDADVTIPVTLPNLMTHVRLTRVEFEAMIRPRIADTIDALRRAVRSAGLTMDQVDRILLVGGSSRIPLVREMVAAATGRPVTIDVHPKHCVAMGAAALARPDATAARTAPTSTNAAPVPPPPPQPPTAAPLTPPTSPSTLVPPPAPSAAGAGSSAFASSPPPPPPTPEPTPSPPTGSADSKPHRGGSKRTLLIAIGAVVIVAIVAVAAIVLGGDDSDESSANTSPSSAVTDSAVTDTTPIDTSGETSDTTDTGGTAEFATETEPFVELLPRSTKYASLTFSIDRFVVRSQDPASFVSGAAAEPDGPHWAYIEGTATNPLVNIPIGFAETEFTLVLIDGTELRGGQFEVDSIAPPSDVGVLNVAFELGDVTDLSNSVIRIGDQGDEPSVIALDGDPIEPDLDRDVFFEPASVSIPDADGNTMDWVLGLSSTSLDSYYDGTDLSDGQSSTDRRAGVGQRLLNMSVTLAAGACDCDGIAADTSTVRLVVDGNPISPTNSISEYLPPSTSLEVGLVFEYPAEATAVTLEFGPADSPDLQQVVQVTLA